MTLQTLGCYLVVEIQIYKAGDALGELRHLPHGLGRAGLAGVEEAQLQALRPPLVTEPHGPQGLTPRVPVPWPGVARHDPCIRAVKGTLEYMIYIDIDITGAHGNITKCVVMKIAYA